MAKILMTGMCSYQDLHIASSDASGVYFYPFAPKIESFQDLLRCFDAAGNTGNYLITEGAYRAFGRHDVVYVPFWNLLRWIKEPDRQKAIVKEYSFCLFVTANLLHPDFDLADEMCVLEAMPIPVVFMSVGVQRAANLAHQLRPNSLKFIEYLKSSDSVVFTRGAMASAFLRGQGVRNVYDASCPSAFSHGEQIIEAIRSLKSLDFSDLNEIWFNGYLGDDGNCAPEMSLFLPLARHVNYVLQDEPRIFRLLEDFSYEAKLYHDGSGLLAKRLKPLENVGDMYVFFSPAQWRARAAAVDLLIGRRFHGNLIGLQAGRPAVIIAHDDRVLEMIEGIGLPHLSAQEWAGTEDKVRLLSSFISSIDFARFEDCYQNARERFSATIKTLFG